MLFPHTEAIIENSQKINKVMNILIYKLGKVQNILWRVKREIDPNKKEHSVYQIKQNY